MDGHEGPTERDAIRPETGAAGKRVFNGFHGYSCDSITHHHTSTWLLIEGLFSMAGCRYVSHILSILSTGYDIYGHTGL
jgi:hypothetical protein